MSHPLLRCAGMLLAASALLSPQAGALSGVSPWAESSLAAAEAASLVPDRLAELSAVAPITREEFCLVAVKLYQAASGKTVSPADDTPFSDCDDPYVAAAYALGIVNGRGSGVFDPNASISRQELCVMLHHILFAAQIDVSDIAGDACVEDYPDVSEISGYAVDAVVAMVDHKIVNGIASGASMYLKPGGTATREQALVMTERFFQEFQTGAPVYDDTLIENGPDNEENASLPTPSSYVTEEDKLLLVYGEGGGKYQSAEEAEEHMIEISVPVWHLEEDGSKISGTAYLTVNRALAPLYQLIFEEIYNGAEQFPIKDVGCYAWRSGEHGQGTAVDINWEENMEATINEDGSLTPTAGTHWTPYEDPYSIPENGDVYNAFAKYGFTWGGNAWSSKRDYMHFSFFGR